MQAIRLQTEYLKNPLGLECEYCVRKPHANLLGN